MIDKTKLIYYALPVLLAIIIFASDFLSTDIFQVNVQNFTVWFVLSIFCFATGWLINKTLGWRHGGKVVFSVIVATVFVSLVMISIFNDYFGINNLLTENLILYSLRNIMLGAMAFFGMAIAEMLSLQNQLAQELQKNHVIKSSEDSNEKRINTLLNEAKLKADKMVFDAESKLRMAEMKIATIELRIKEIIQIEKELIKKYEQEDNNSQ